MQINSKIWKHQDLNIKLNVCKYSLGREDSIQSRDKDTRNKSSIYTCMRKQLNECKYSLGHEASIQSRDKDTRIRVKHIYEKTVKGMRIQTREYRCCKTIWLKSDLYFRYRIEDLITPNYWSCSVELCICILHDEFD